MSPRVIGAALWLDKSVLITVSRHSMHFGWILMQFVKHIDNFVSENNVKSMILRALFRARIARNNNSVQTSNQVIKLNHLRTTRGIHNAV